MLERRSDKLYSIANLVDTTMTTTTTTANSFLAPVTSTRTHSQAIVTETLFHAHRRKHLHTHIYSYVEYVFSSLLWSMKFKLNEIVPCIRKDICCSFIFIIIFYFSLASSSFPTKQPIVGFFIVDIFGWFEFYEIPRSEFILLEQ